MLTRNDAGSAAPRGWVGRFCDTYTAHAAVIRVLSQAEIAGWLRLTPAAKAIFTGSRDARKSRGQAGGSCSTPCLTCLAALGVDAGAA